MAPEFHDWFSKHHHHHHHHHPLRVRPWYTCFTKHVTLIQYPHTNLFFLNSISILPSKLHLHLFILKVLNPTFCMNSSFCLHVHMSYVSNHPWFNYFRASIRHRPKSVDITFQFNTSGEYKLEKSCSKNPSKIEQGLLYNYDHVSH
jgi:hypothetical protein